MKLTREYILDILMIIHLTIWIFIGLIFIFIPFIIKKGLGLE